MQVFRSPRILPSRPRRCWTVISESGSETVVYIKPREASSPTGSAVRFWKPSGCVPPCCQPPTQGTALERVLDSGQRCFSSILVVNGELGKSQLLWASVSSRVTGRSRQRWPSGLLLQRLTFPAFCFCSSLPTSWSLPPLLSLFQLPSLLPLRFFSKDPTWPPS